LGTQIQVGIPFTVEHSSFVPQVGLHTGVQVVPSPEKLGPLQTQVSGAVQFALGSQDGVEHKGSQIPGDPRFSPNPTSQIQVGVPSIFVQVESGWHEGLQTGLQVVPSPEKLGELQTQVSGAVQFALGSQGGVEHKGSQIPGEPKFSPNPTSQIQVGVPSIFVQVDLVKILVMEFVNLYVVLNVLMMLHVLLLILVYVIVDLH